MNKIKIIRCKMYKTNFFSNIEFLKFLPSSSYFFFYYFNSRINYIVNYKVNYYVIRKEMLVQKSNVVIYNLFIEKN